MTIKNTVGVGPAFWCILAGIVLFVAGTCTSCSADSRRSNK